MGVLLPSAMAIPMAEALALGAVGGATEILPVSGGAHLALARLYLGWEASPAVDAMTRAAALVATLVVLHEAAFQAVRDGVRGIAHGSLLRDAPGGRMAVTVAMAALPSVVLTLLLRRSADAWGGSPTMLGASLLASAVLVASTRWAPPGDRDVPSAGGSLLLGVAVGAAALPGLARIALAVTALLWLGVRRDRAADVALLASVPALATELVGSGPVAAHDAHGAWVLASMGAVSVLAALVACAIVRAAIRQGRLPLFAFYIAPLACAALAWGYARP